MLYDSRFTVVFELIILSKQELKRPKGFSLKWDTERLQTHIREAGTYKYFTFVFNKLLPVFNYES